VIRPVDVEALGLDEETVHGIQTAERRSHVAATGECPCPFCSYKDAEIQRLRRKNAKRDNEVWRLTDERDQQAHRIAQQHAENGRLVEMLAAEEDRADRLQAELSRLQDAATDAWVEGAIEYEDLTTATMQIIETYRPNWWDRLKARVWS
jgi:hypothetical protein